MTRTAEPSTAPPVALVGATLRLRDERTFGLGDDAPCARFLQRVFRLDDVRAVALDRNKGEAEVRLERRPADPAAFLRRLSETLRDDRATAFALPRGLRETTLTIHRRGDRLTTCEILGDRPGVLRFRHDALRRNPSLARLAEPYFASVPGVTRATFGAWSESLTIRYDPAVVNASRLIRMAEEALDGGDWWGRALPPPTRTRYALANTNLGLAALVDFAFPVLAPASALLLLYNNRRTFRAALLQARRRKLGLPLLYTVIVGATLAGGQFLASALMSWCFQYWHGRLRHELSDERRRLLDECLPMPSLARLIAADGGEVLVPVDRLRPGDLVAVGADEPAPADGRVVEGEGIVDEQSIRGLTGASRRRAGDALLAGSRVLAGSFRIEVARPPGQTRASAIGRSLVAATSPAAGTLSPTRHAEAFAERAVGPTMAAAGVGLLAGDLTAFSAILRPDYATGLGVAGPLQALHDAADCARRGIVVRSPETFHRLAAADLLVVDDAPALRTRRLEVAEVRARIPDDLVLRYAASAYRHIADDRAAALAAACRDPLLDLPAVAYDPGVVVVHGPRRIRVREAGPQRESPLIVEIDDAPVGWIEFQYASRPAHAPLLHRLRQSRDVPVILLSDRDELEAAALASSIGASAHVGRLTPDDRRRFLRDLRARGLRPAYLGDGRAPGAADSAHVAVSLGGDLETDESHADAVLLRPGLDAFADLWEVAHRHVDRNRSAQRFILLPNILCVAGAFLLGATALTAVVVSNLGTLGLYSQAAGSLHALRPVGRRRAQPRAPIQPQR